MGSVVKAKVGELEKITRDGRIRRTKKYVVRCVHSVAEKKKFLILFEYGNKKEIGSSLLVYLCEKEEVEMEELISPPPPKNKKTYC